MTTVFGIDIPLFEILIIFMVMLTAGIVFILIELKKLNDYLIVERTDLQRLERDLGLLEDEERRFNVDEQRLGLVARPKVPPQPPVGPA